jgi:hypothetical protein
MKKILIIAALCISYCLNAQKDKSHFYYFDDEKIILEVNIGRFTNQL